MLSRAIVLVGLVALPACQILDGTAARTPGAPPDSVQVAGADQPAAAPSGYPSLHTVPPRPRLSYSVEQRRAIVDGLVADRELARYTDQVVRYRSGQSSLPPPPEPPRQVAAADTAGLIEPETPAPPAEPAALPSSGDDGGLGGYNDNDNQDDTLDSFVDDLARDPLEEQADQYGVPGAPPEPADADQPGLWDWLSGLLGRAEPDPPTSTAVLAAVPAMQPATAAAPDAAHADAVPARPRPDGPGIAVGEEGIAIEGGAIEGGGAVGGGRAGGVAKVAGTGEVRVGKASSSPAPAKADLQAEPQAVAAVAASAPAGRIAFAPDSAELPAGAAAQLEQVLARAKAQGATIRILGEAPAPTLALDRARAVGLALVGLGARASDLEMTLARGARGDQARLLLAGPASR